jgi:solute carrier family 25 (mitochondrial carnitine/acylcarnitine transporter), member 20/29
MTSLYNDTCKHYFSGAISGVSAIIVSHPIDTIKTNYQEKLPIKLDLKHLYKGITAPIVGIGLEKALVFGSYNTMYNYTNSHTISGALSGLTAAFIVTPYERIKILLQTNNTHKTSISMSPRFLFQGLSATFYREVPGFAIYFSVYNYLKDYVSRMYKRDINTLESFTFGGLSGAISWVFIYPQDRIKTHIQSTSSKKISLRQGLKDIVDDGGIRSLYRGFHFALLRAIPLHAVAFMVNEKCKKYL